MNAPKEKIHIEELVMCMPDDMHTKARAFDELCNGMEPQKAPFLFVKQAPRIPRETSPSGIGFVLGFVISFVLFFFALGHFFDWAIGDAGKWIAMLTVDAFKNVGGVR